VAVVGERAPDRRGEPHVVLDDEDTPPTGHGHGR
jgi:hypothetical protein